MCFMDFGVVACFVSVRYCSRFYAINFCMDGDHFKFTSLCTINAFCNDALEAQQISVLQCNKAGGNNPLVLCITYT